MNKKGIFIPVLVILSLVVFSYAYYILILQNPSKEIERNLGGYVSNLAGKFDEGKKHEFFIKESIRLSSNNALLKLSENGGFSKPEVVTDCKITDDGYVIWNVDCDPTSNLEGNFITLFSESFEQYLSNNYIENIYDYDLEFNENNLNISLIANKAVLYVDTSVQYRLDTSTTESIDYNLTQYKIINDFLNSKKDCFLGGVDYNDCIVNSNWKVVKVGDVFKFDIESEQVYLIENNDKIEARKIIIKFAKDFKTEDLLG